VLQCHCGRSTVWGIGGEEVENVLVSFKSVGIVGERRGVKRERKIIFLSTVSLPGNSHSRSHSVSQHFLLGVKREPWASLSRAGAVRLATLYAISSGETSGACERNHHSEAMKKDNSKENREKDGEVLNFEKNIGSF